MKETKMKRLGRKKAIESLALITSLIPNGQRERYDSRLLNELGKYSFRPRKRDEKPHEGCRSWIEEVDLESEEDLKDPRKYARFLMGMMDGLYNKDHARSFYAGFLEEFGERRHF